MTVPILLAKSCTDPTVPPPWATLVDHSLLTQRVASYLVSVQARDLLAFVGLPDDWRDRLCLAAELAAIVHDLGKANDHFQSLVRHQLDGPQGHRHEFLSLWLSSAAPMLGSWLFRSQSPEVRFAALCAVAGHHLKFENLPSLAYRDACPLAALDVLADHPDVGRILHAAAGLLGEAQPPTLTRHSFDAVDNLLDDALGPVVVGLERSLRSGPPEQRALCSLVRAIVISADVAASTARTWKQARELAMRAFDQTCTPDRLRQLVERRSAGASLREFQLAVGASPTDVTVVEAGCGTGKTLAAYLWAARRAVGRKLFFCYPTTGTATEGFTDYVHGADLAGGLFHGRAEVDLASLDNGDEDPPDVLRRQAAALDSLRLWLPEVAVCTADVVLGLLQNYRTPLFGFPAVAMGAFVFDEVHQYDDRMFAALCRLVTSLRAPLLLMSASLQSERLALLQEAAASVSLELQMIGGPPELELGKRYELRRAALEEAREAALLTIERGEKILWVSNTVDGAVRAATWLRDRGASPLVYHSRFRYQDRAERHRQVVDSFRLPGPMLAVTTQVCEVSLDISADLLITEIAPVPAMVQRLGRLNRRFDPDRPQTRPALFVQPPIPHPYEKADLESGDRWLAEVVGGRRSQRDLAAAFEALGPGNADKAPVECVFFDQLPFARQAPLREAEPSISIVLGEDAPACRAPGGRFNAAELVRRQIPMPLGPVAQIYRAWPRLAMAVVPPQNAVDYSPEFGARWRK